MTSRMMAMTLCVALIATGCASTSLKSYKPKTDDETQVISVLMRISRGMESKSMETLLQPYADDVYIGNFQKYIGVSSPGAPTRVSKLELAQAYVQLFKSTKELSMDITEFRLTVSGDRAVAEGRLEILYKIEAGRKEARSDYIRADVTWRLKRTPLGWKIAEEVFQ
ncbi:MAG: nuclear transport factor 2 family protein [candidate division NC10 bacterium]|nr:nuclear transport factor 2 family protein [candidate division NC10 bacterium]